ncbi:MAG: hypothetical protein ABSG44_06175 [Thermodesulfobacteriota bacterium]
MVSFQGDGCHFPLSFHLVNNKGYHGEVKAPGGRVEVKGHFNSFLELNMELELIEVDCDGVRFRTFHHFLNPQNPIEKTGDFITTGSN